MAARRLLVHFSVSVDGFASHGNAAPDWRRPDRAGPDYGDARHQANVELVGRMGLILMGRVAYDDMVQAWPGGDSDMARLMNTTPKVIFSRSLQRAEWENATVSDQPLETEIPRLKAQAGGDIIAFGGARFLNSLSATGLVDEFRLTVQPVALGRGTGLFHGLPEPLPLELVDAAVYADGTVVQTLRPA
jgi:dihydrofolate reductase